VTLRLKWPVDSSIITQPFGANPQYYGPLLGKLGCGHEGIDFRAGLGANVYACADGEVYAVYYGGAYGNQVRLLHTDGYRTIYAHLQQSKVRIGDRVLAGQLIGLADSTGNSTGSHLHVTLKKDGATLRGETKYPNDIIDITPFLTFPLANLPAIIPPATMRLRTKANLNLRAGPGLSYQILALLKFTAVIECLDPVETTREKIGRATQWIHVRLGMLSGWVNALYVEEI
jgi:murein DD-endopeptidase MepM/ murein hydrolase activator NlpD